MGGHSPLVSCVMRLFIPQGYRALRTGAMRSIIGTAMTKRSCDANETRDADSSLFSSLILSSPPLPFLSLFLSEDITPRRSFPRVPPPPLSFLPVTIYAFSIRIGSIVWPWCQISIIACPFRPTGGYSGNDVIVTRKGASMCVTMGGGGIAGQLVYLLDHIDIAAEIVVLCRF